jgi:ketosteroid isomerase-like protein
MKSISLAMLASLLLASQPSRVLPQSSAGPSAEIGQLRALETAMMAAAAKNGADGYVSFYADDAVELPNGAPALQGKEDIRKTMAFLDDKENHLTWTPVRVEVSGSGDLGYTYGVYEFRSIDKDGKPAVANGKYATVWKKQADGRRKVALDMGNASPEPTPRSLR